MNALESDNIMLGQNGGYRFTVRVNNEGERIYRDIVFYIDDFIIGSKGFFITVNSNKEINRKYCLIRLQLVDFEETTTISGDQYEDDINLLSNIKGVSITIEFQLPSGDKRYLCGFEMTQEAYYCDEIDYGRSIHCRDFETDSNYEV